MRGAIRGGTSNPKVASLIVVYSLSKALGISPLEVYKMPMSLVKDLLTVHQQIELLQAEELDKTIKKAKV